MLDQYKEIKTELFWSYEGSHAKRSRIIIGLFDQGALPKM